MIEILFQTIKARQTKRQLLSVIAVCLLLGCQAPLPGMLTNTLPGKVTSKAFCQNQNPVCIQSLTDLSVASLRQRSYGSQLRLEVRLSGDTTPINTMPNTMPNTTLNTTPNNYQQHYSKDGSPVYDSFIASYLSDDLRVYSRLDLPAGEMPQTGYPIIIFAHGWIGKDAAPLYDFGYNTHSLYGEIIDSYVDAGFAVLTPGYRGHGSVNGTPAEGWEYMDAWDNKTYLAPTFYAIDILNLANGLGSLERLNWDAVGHQTTKALRFDTQSIYLASHSQGGDAALTALAVASNNSKLAPSFKAASIMAGNIPDRVTQARAFATTGTSLQSVYEQMYTILNKQVEDLSGASFSLHESQSGELYIQHDPEVESQLLSIGGYRQAALLTQPINFHYSDQDYYSVPAWNADLATRINAAGGEAKTYCYPYNSHSLKARPSPLFSPKGTMHGLRQAIQRDVSLFSSHYLSLPLITSFHRQ